MSTRLQAARPSVATIYLRLVHTMRSLLMRANGRTLVPRIGQGNAESRLNLRCDIGLTRGV
jgi:hypothetical protein